MKGRTVVSPPQTVVSPTHGHGLLWWKEGVIYISKTHMKTGNLAERGQQPFAHNSLITPPSSHILLAQSLTLS